MNTHTLAAVAVRIGLILQDHESWNADTLDQIADTFHTAHLTAEADGLFQLQIPCSACGAVCHRPVRADDWAHVEPPEDGHPARIEPAAPTDRP